METSANSVEALVENLEAYTKTTFQLTKLKALQAATTTVSSLIANISVVLAIAVFGLVFNIGVALWLGEVLGKVYYGFFIVAAFYLIAAIVLHLFLFKWIKKPISQLIITQALQ